MCSSVFPFNLVRRHGDNDDADDDTHDEDDEDGVDNFERRIYSV